jgi:hypothetical protein
MPARSANRRLLTILDPEEKHGARPLLHDGRSAATSSSAEPERAAPPSGRGRRPAPCHFLARTVTVNDAAAVLALVSVASQRTLVRPTLKRLPDFG